jgi:hypothetical protein
MQSTLSRNLRRTSSQLRIPKYRCTPTLPSSETARSEVPVEISRLVYSQDPLGYNIEMEKSCFYGLSCWLKLTRCSGCSGNGWLKIHILVDGSFRGEGFFSGEGTHDATRLGFYDGIASSMAFA